MNIKRIYLGLFLGLVLALSACGAGSQAAADGQDSPAPSEAAQVSEPSAAAAARPEETQTQKEAASQGGALPAPTEEISEPSAPAAAQPAEAQTGSAEYTIERQDRSVANSDGSTALSWYYDLVQLTGDTPEVQAINDSLSAHCEEFFAENSGDVPLEKRADDLWLNTMDATVTQNGDGLLSVCMARTWYMGGVASTDYLGYTYDLATGEELGLADLTGQEADALATTLREIVKAYMAGQPEVDWWDDAADTVDSRSLEDMMFWVDGGEIVLCFDTYDLTIGAYGPVVIPTGVMAEH